MLVETYSFHEDRECDDLRCNRIINTGDKAFTDGEGHMYCESCGLCIRYEEKKLAQRQELGIETRRIIGLNEEEQDGVCNRPR